MSRKDDIAEYGSAIGGRVAVIVDECADLLRSIRKGFGLFTSSDSCEVEATKQNNCHEGSKND